jgi:hypothetical protein
MADLSDIVALDQFVYKNGVLPPGWALLPPVQGGNIEADGFLAQSFENSAARSLSLSEARTIGVTICMRLQIRV